MASTKLTDEQITVLKTWAAQGAAMGDIQNRLREELGINITYMETRLLLLDLDISLIDAPSEEEKKPAPEAVVEAEDEEDFSAEDAASGVRVSVDELVIPGAVVSGKVTFGDGKSASWYVDQQGRLGMSGAEPGYKPSEADLIAFQRQLQSLLKHQGY